jgi:hypothetical protein
MHDTQGCLSSATGRIYACLTFNKLLSQGFFRLGETASSDDTPYSTVTDFARFRG